MADQLKERDRQREFVKDVLYPFLVANCKSVEDMRMRVVSTHEALKGAWSVEQSKWIKEHSERLVKDWNPTPLPGEGTTIEQGLINLFAEESMTMADKLLNDFPGFLDLHIKEEMKERDPKTLKVKLL